VIRRSKQLAPLLVGVLFASSLLLNTANAAGLKVGTACHKAGASQSSNGVVYLCKKSGKKLVWVIALGVKNTPFPTPSATPTESATHSPTATPTATMGNSQIIWDWNGSKWSASGTPPACILPIIPTGALLDFTKALSLVQPGQSRGGSYKPHGGLRWSVYGTYTPNVKISVPFNGYVVQAWQYLVDGIYQFGVNMENPCGIMVRIGHMHIPSAQFTQILSSIPAAAENDSREYQISPPAAVKKGDIITTGVGMPAPATADNLGAYIDLGVLDLRHVNPILGSNFSNNADLKYSMYSLCWYQGNYLSPSDQTIAGNLPLANGDPKSDYCSTY
jgi:hypothetical protein